jgi:hypothetical protein
VVTKVSSEMSKHNVLFITRPSSKAQSHSDCQLPFLFQKLSDHHFIFEKYFCINGGFKYPFKAQSRKCK